MCGSGIRAAGGAELRTEKDAGPPSDRGSRNYNSELCGGINREFRTYARLAGRLDVGFVMMIGGCVASVLNLADDRQVLRFQVPWTTLVMLGGVSMLIGVGKEAGVGRSFWPVLISGHLPEDSMIAPVLSLSAGLMSVFSSAISVVLPDVVSSGAGTDERYRSLRTVDVFCDLRLSDHYGNLTTLSTTGSMILGGCKSEKVRSRLFYQV